MAAKEITSKEYQALKSDLNEGMPVSALAPKYKLGERRVRQIRDSKSFKGYLQKRANERRSRQQNTPAKAVAGAHELEQENQGFMAETPDGESVPADKVKPTASGAVDLRSQEEKDEADAVRRRAKKTREQAEREAAAHRAAVFGQVFTIAVMLFAVVGVIATLYGLVQLLT